MSEQSNTYVMAAARFGYGDLTESMVDKLADEYTDNAFKGISHKNGLCAVMDGMNGNYIFIGRVLEKSNEGEGISNPFNAGSAMKSIDLPAIDKKIEAELGLTCACSIWVFTHYR